MSTWIAFTGLRLELCLLNTTSHEVRHFFPDMHVEYYTWSPDGRYLAFSALPEPSTNGLYTLSLFEIESKTLQQVAQTRGRIIWSWSPDGRKLAFLDEQYGDASWVMAVEHGTKERLGVEPALPSGRGRVVSWTLPLTGEDGMLWGLPATEHRFRKVSE